MTYFLAMIAGVFAFIFGIVITRADIGLGQEAYGIFIMGQAIISIVGCITWGINQSIQKYVAEYLVTSKEEAESYARNGTIVIILFATITCILFIIGGILFFPVSPVIGLILLIVGPTLLIMSLKDGILGNIAAVQRFDYVAVINAVLGVGLFIVGIPLVLFVIKPNPVQLQNLAPLTVLGICCGVIIQVLISWYYGRKCLPFKIEKLYKGEKNRRIMWKILKYGLYCAIPTIILSGSILWIPALLIPVVLGTTVLGFEVTGLFGVIVGYSVVILTISFMGWPMISAVSEAHAKGDQKLIDDYFRSNFKSSFNFIALFLTIYIGMSLPILGIFHGPEYMYGQLPFIILAIAVALLAIEFICCTVIIGVGEGRKASVVFSIITVSEIVLTILFLYIFPASILSYAAPIAILISSGIMFPFIPRLLKPHTSVPFPRDTLWKCTVSLVVAIGVGVLIDTFLYSFMSLIGIVVGIIILGLVYFFCMLLLAGFDDDDFEMIYDSLKTFNLGALTRVVKAAEAITHKSPFYKEKKKDNELTEE